MKIGKFLSKELTASKHYNLKNSIRFWRNYLKSIGYGDNLNKLADINKTDKWGSHYYTQHYQSHFYKLKNKKIKLLEIGVGGYDDPFNGGASLRMWKRYFTKGKIYSIDIFDKSPQQENRIKIFQGSQIDEIFLKKVILEISEPDIIIDDGSHLNEHVIKTFNILFPFLKTNGIYVIEDVQTSYWPEAGGDSNDLQNANNTMNFFKKLSDGLNHEEYLKPDYNPTYFDMNIVSIHFYHNLIFIHKGDNHEGSNSVKNGKLIDENA